MKNIQAQTDGQRRDRETFKRKRNIEEIQMQRRSDRQKERETDQWRDGQTGGQREDNWTNGETRKKRDRKTETETQMNLTNK